MKLKRATIKDIARESGYSVMTVSFALRNHEKVKPATREKIQKVAERLGYRADPEMVRLMHRVRNNRELETVEQFAVLNLNRNRDDFKRELFTQRVMKGTAERLNRHGFDLVEYWVGEQDFKARAVTEDLLERKIRTLLVPPVPKEAPLVNELDWSKFTVASIDERPILPNFHRIHPHHYNNMLKLLEKLMASGFERVGFLSTGSMLGLDRYAYFGAFYTFHHQMHPGRAFLPPLEHSDDQKRLKKWWQEHKPDAIILTTSWLDGYLRAALGISVPEDVSVACITSDFDPHAGIDQKLDLLGAAAADMLMAHTLRYEKGVPPFAKTVMIDGEWKDGPSVQPKR